jgi:hypothetical protein
MATQLDFFGVDPLPKKEFTGRILVIDSHKASHDGSVDNLHWQNARMIADALGADLIWSYPNVNDYVRGDYEAIVFVHASHYAFTDYAWIEQSPNAKLYYVTNEYNLGEPRTLWMAAKAGRKYTVLANHPHNVSKVVTKYVDDWISLNLNALVYGNYSFENARNQKCIYYGSYRDDRKEYFKKYFDNMTVSTHMKNRIKMDALNITPHYINRLNIQKGDLANYGFSLYIEDKKTHKAYNHMANRFYEALNSGTMCVFDESCQGTLDLSNYEIDSDLVIKNSQELIGVIDSYNKTWSNSIHMQAAADKKRTIELIQQVVL